MAALLRAVACVAAVCSLAACATSQDLLEHKENRLAAAGFIARPANTPERLAMLQRLPPDHFSARRVGDTYVYLFPDPLVCGCLFVGSVTAYSRYRQELLRQHLARERPGMVNVFSDPTWSFDPWGGPFGPGFGPGYGPAFY